MREVNKCDIDFKFPFFLQTIVLFLYFLMTNLSFAQDQNLTGNNTITIQSAYESEIRFLSAQKKSLLELKTTLVKQKDQKVVMAKQEIEKKQNELVNLQSKIQLMSEEYKQLEKNLKEGAQVKVQLDKTSLKSLETLEAVRAKMGLPMERFDDSKSKVETNEKFIWMMSQVFLTIQELASLKWRPHAFLDSNDQLVEGEVMLYGLFAAWGKKRGDSNVILLSPYNKDFLKEVSGYSGKNIDAVPMSIFTSDFQKVSLLAAKTWKETLADGVPLLIMGIILLMVFGLFLMLART